MVNAPFAVFPSILVSPAEDSNPFVRFGQDFSKKAKARASGDARRQRKNVLTGKSVRTYQHPVYRHFARYTGCCAEGLLLNDRSRLAGEGKRGLFKGTDDRFSSCLGGGKLHAGLDLGQHASGGKLPLLSICLCLPAAHLLDLFLIGLIEVDAHSVNSGENVEILCVNDLRKALGGTPLRWYLSSQITGIPPPQAITRKTASTRCRMLALPCATRSTIVLAALTTFAFCSSGVLPRAFPPSAITILAMALSRRCPCCRARIQAPLSRLPWRARRTISFPA